MIKFFLLLLPAIALAGADQPWNDGGGGGGGSGPSLLLLAAVFIPYLYAMGRWPFELILLTLCAIAGGTVAKWFGDPFGWIVGIALAFKALSGRHGTKNDCSSVLDGTSKGNSLPDDDHTQKTSENCILGSGEKASELASILDCPKCQQALRVPSKKLLDITCPKCRHVFRRST